MNDFQEGFTFTWKIENFSMLPHQQGEALKSPTFIDENTLEKIKLHMAIFPKGVKGEENANFLSLFLSKVDMDENEEDIASNISFTLTLESLNSALKKSFTARNVDIDTSGTGPLDFLSLKTLYDNKDMYLPQDVLTVCCRICSSQDKGNATISSSYFEKRCSARTTFDVHKRVLTWPITKISELKKSKEKISIPISSNNLEDSPDVELSFCIDKNSNDGYARIEILVIEPSDEEDPSEEFVKCKITVVNADNEQCPSYEASHLFNCVVDDDDDDDEIWNLPDKIWHFPNFIFIDNIIDHKYIYVDDTLFLQCEFAFSRMSTAHHSELPVYMPNAFPFRKKEVTELTDLSRKLGSLFAREKFCDVEVRAGSKTFPCHKLILCAQSPVFTAMFEIDMKESKTGVVEITDLNPQTVEILLNFLYLESIEDGLSVEDICELYSAAHMYEILLLQKRCSILLVSKLSVASICEVLATADTHQDHFLLTHVNTFLSIHSREVFHSTQWKAFMVENPALSKETMIKICIE